MSETEYIPEHAETIEVTPDPVQAAPDPVQPTQVQHPKRATLRTALQSAIGVLLALGAVVPAATQILGETFRQWLPDQAITVMGTIAAVAVAVSAALARIMAIAQVNAWLKKVGLDTGHTEPEPEAPPEGA